MESNEISEIGFSFLRECHQIEEIRLNNNSLSTVDLSAFSDHQNVRLLDLSLNKIKEIDLSPLSNLPSLERIKLCDNELKEVDLTPLKGNSRLLRIDLAHNKLRSVDLTPLAHLPALRELWLYLNEIQSIDLLPLGQIESLQELRLERNRLLSINLDPLIRCRHLKDLQLSNNLIQEADISSLFSCQRLKTFEIDHNVTLIASSNLREHHTIPNGVKSVLDRVEWTPIKKEESIPIEVKTTEFGMEKWSGFWKDVLKCIKKEAKEIGLPVESQELSEEQYIQFVRLQAKCYYGKMSKVGDKRFDEMINELLKPIMIERKKLDEKLFRYYSKFGDPRKLVEAESFVKKVNAAIWAEIELSIDSEDARMMGRLWIISFINELTFTSLLESIRPLLDIVGLANIALKLDLNWAASLIALVLEEAMVKDRLRAMGIEPRRKDSYHKLTEKLVEKYKEQGVRPITELLLSDGYRNIRHEVVHDPIKWNPSEDDTSEIIRHAVSLARFLYPDSFKDE